MNAPLKPLADHEARRAMAIHDRSSGGGLFALRRPSGWEITIMMAGIAPRHVAAVIFTESAAGELRPASAGLSPS